MDSEEGVNQTSEASKGNCASGAKCAYKSPKGLCKDGSFQMHETLANATEIGDEEID